MTTFPCLRTKVRSLLLWGGGFGAFSYAAANDVRLENLQWDPPYLRVTVSWHHSWNYYDSVPPYNFDACWIFGKYYAAGRWHPLRFSPDTADYAAAGPLRVLTVDDSAGFFVMRARNGEGRVPPTVLTVRLPQGPPADASLAVMAVEMVYVPPGPFYVGDGASFNALRRAADDSPYYVAQPHIPSGALSCLDDTAFQAADSIPPEYPTGWHGFFVMKHEISQAAYIQFLNMLPSAAAQGTRTGADPTRPAGTPVYPHGRTFRNGLVILRPAEGGRPARFGADANPASPPNDTDDAAPRAMNFLNWDDLLAWLDWAGLRPMTELEFEKAARGPLPPQAGEFAWGTPYVVDANTLRYDGTPSETHAETIPPDHGIGVHGYDGPTGPLRCGFAARPNTTRRTAGASYYGVMELSGNVWEQCVKVTSEGVAFRPAHGDGRLGAGGAADVPGWVGAVGAMYRGGAWNSGIFARFRDLAVSDRYYVYLAPTQRRNTTGGRGARSYPLHKIYP